MNESDGAIPPFDEAAEAGCLACILSAEGREAERMLASVALDDFYDVRHREIFLGLSHLAREHKPGDTVNLAQWLRDNGKIEDAGGLAYVSTLPDQAPSVANFPSFLEVVKDRSTRRAVTRDAGELQALARDKSVPPRTLADAARRMAEAYSRNGSGSILEILERTRFNHKIQPPPLRVIYELAGQPVSTPGNITSIASTIKSGKSAVIGAMEAAPMPCCAAADLLGFKSSNPNGFALLHFDSEQAPDDFWFCDDRAVRRAGLKEPPQWYQSFCLTGLGYKLGWQCVEEAIRTAAEKFGGIHSVLLDGAADFVADVNDPAEKSTVKLPSNYRQDGSPDLSTVIPSRPYM